MKFLKNCDNVQNDSLGKFYDKFVGIVREKILVGFFEKDIKLYGDNA